MKRKNKRMSRRRWTNKDDDGEMAGKVEEEEDKIFQR